MVVTEVGPLPVKPLPGDLKLTLLSPGVQQLSDLRPKWEQECFLAKLDPAKPLPPPVIVPPGLEAFGPVDIGLLARAPFSGDTSEANGSSIAVLAEFEGRRLLLAADAHAQVLLGSIERLIAESGEERLKLDAFKLPHHGSKANLSPALLAKIECPRYLFSTSGAQFKHPDKEAVARAIRLGGQSPELVFNYSSEFDALWDNADWMSRYGYRVRYPTAGTAGMVVEL